jgi:hypothetical protein
LSKSQTLKYLLLDATSRPYINYAFANPGDTSNTYHTACLLQEDDSPKQRMEYAVTCYNDAMAKVYEWRVDAVRYLRKIQSQKGRRRWPTIADRKEERENGGVYGDDYRYAKWRINDYMAEAYAAKARYAEAKEQYDAEQAKPKAPRNRDKDFLRLLGNMGKNYGITPRRTYGTVEFRIFQAPESREEHELHVDFALAYVEWCEWQAKTGAMPLATYRTKEELLTEWPLERCKAEFIKFCKTIGLKASQYKRYLSNMEHRFALGAEYL